MASSDTDDDIIISSALLVASTPYQRRQVNIRKYKRNSWARKQINWPITARRQSEKSPKNRDGSSNLVAQLVKSWQLTMSNRQLCWAIKLCDKVARLCCVSGIMLKVSDTLTVMKNKMLTCNRLEQLPGGSGGNWISSSLMLAGDCDDVRTAVIQYSQTPSCSVLTTSSRLSVLMTAKWMSHLKQQIDCYQLLW